MISVHDQVTAAISKFSPQVSEIYFRLYGRLTTKESYTVGSSIFVSYTLGYSIFLTVILQGPQFCKYYTPGLSTE